VLDGRANGGWRVRSLANFPHRYPGTSTEKAGEMAGGTFKRGGKSVSFLCLAVSVPPPLALEVTRGLDKVESRDGRTGNDLGPGLTGCDGRIDERPREEDLSTSLSSHISGKIEVTRELD
jgi:hypothetical protein